MKHLFIPYELALIAKEKGFNEDCLAAYSFNSKEIIGIGYYTDNRQLLAPLYEQMIDWLEDKFDFFFERLMNEDKGVYYIVWNGTAAYSELKTIDKAIEEAFSLIKPISTTEA